LNSAFSLFIFFIVTGAISTVGINNLTVNGYPDGNYSQVFSTLKNDSGIHNSNATYVLVFEQRKVANIDNNTKLVPAIVGNDSDKIKEELLKEISLAPSPELRHRIDKVVDDGIKGLPCELAPISTQDGVIVSINCISSGHHVVWFVYPSRLVHPPP
jgi:hypothetical protein